MIDALCDIVDLVGILLVPIGGYITPMSWECKCGSDITQNESWFRSTYFISAPEWISPFQPNVEKCDHTQKQGMDEHFRPKTQIFQMFKNEMHSLIIFLYSEFWYLYCSLFTVHCSQFLVQCSLFAAVSTNELMYTPFHSHILYCPCDEIT